MLVSARDRAAPRITPRRRSEKSSNLDAGEHEVTKRDFAIKPRFLEAVPPDGVVCEFCQSRTATTGHKLASPRSRAQDAFARGGVGVRGGSTVFGGTGWCALSAGARNRTPSIHCLRKPPRTRDRVLHVLPLVTTREGAARSTRTEHANTHLATLGTHRIPREHTNASGKERLLHSSGCFEPGKTRRKGNQASAGAEPRT